MWLFVVILGWPMVEIALFVVIGGQIGLWATLAWVLFSGLLGVLVVRIAIARQSLSIRDMRDPLTLAAAGAIGMLAGLLLILPGFLTDAVGLLLLVPPVQAQVARSLAVRGKILRPHQTVHFDIIDGDYTEVPPRRSEPSGWTRID
jgi:UPF0716 protein FxsA